MSNYNDNKPITAYKALDKNFKCKGFQFEVGKTYEVEGDIKLCERGFHACENPLDVWDYYEFCESRFALVELSGQVKKGSNNTKLCAAKIEIKAELKLEDFIISAVNRSVEWLAEALKSGKAEEKVQAAAGDYSRLAASGYEAKLVAAGYAAQLATVGNYSRLAAAGDNSNLTASGYASKLAASGNSSRIAAVGDDSKLAAAGCHSRLAAAGDNSRLAASGANSVIVSAGPYSKFNGVDGTLFCLTHYDSEGKPTKLVTGRVGENGIEAGQWYGLDDKGELEKT